MCLKFRNLTGSRYHSSWINNTYPHRKYFKKKTWCFGAGLRLEPGKRYSTTVDRSFHISMAALDCSSVKSGNCKINFKLLITKNFESLKYT